MMTVKLVRGEGLNVVWAGRMITIPRKGETVMFDGDKDGVVCCITHDLDEHCVLIELE